MTVSEHPQYTAEEKRKRVFAIISASSGNLVEWFDFYVYSFASIYFASQFFPSGNATAEFLKSAAVFAVGFFMRPIGGWMFGRIADRVGRKKSMLISVLMMCAGALARWPSPCCRPTPASASPRLSCC